jgi:hypothetical protein
MTNFLPPSTSSPIGALVMRHEATSRPNLVDGSNENLNNCELWLTVAFSWSLNSSHLSGLSAEKQEKELSVGRKCRNKTVKKYKD